MAAIGSPATPEDLSYLMLYAHALPHLYVVLYVMWGTRMAPAWATFAETTSGPIAP